MAPHDPANDQLTGQTIDPSGPGEPGSGPVAAVPDDPAPPEDGLLPAVPHLLGDDVGDLLEVAVAGAGGRLLEHRPAQVLYQPGRSLTVRFATRVAWSDGRERSETLLAGTTAEGAPEGTLPLRADDLEVGVWRYPFDPGLPGLATAVHADRVADFLAGALGPGPDLTVRTYRPGRRAVVEAVGHDGNAPVRAFLKVVRPAEVDRLVTVHRRLAAHLPVPEVLAVDRDAGLVALAAIPGVPLRAALGDPTGARPDPTEVLALLDGLRAAALPSPARPRLAALPAAQAHLQLLARVLPGQADRLTCIGDRLARLAERHAPPPAERPVIVHGDFHDAQVMVADGVVSGLLDLDDAGPGDPLDDPGTMLAHLHTIALGTGPGPAAAGEWATRLRREAGHHLDLPALDARVAAVAVGLATGPFRVQQPGWEHQTERRLALAERWLDRAEGDRRHPTGPEVLGSPAPGTAGERSLSPAS